MKVGMEDLIHRGARRTEGRGSWIDTQVSIRVASPTDGERLRAMFSHLSSETIYLRYLMDLVFSAADNRLAFGFSKTATPSSAADFCPYELTFGSEFPDFPKLGDLRGRVVSSS